jgi:hypothetical protein
MSVSVFAGRVGAALTVAIGATKLTFLFVLNMFVLFAGAGRTVAVAGGITDAAFGHTHSTPKISLKTKVN